MRSAVAVTAACALALVDCGSNQQRDPSADPTLPATNSAEPTDEGRREATAATSSRRYASSASFSSRGAYLALAFAVNNDSSSDKLRQLLRAADMQWAKVTSPRAVRDERSAEVSS